MLPLKWDTSRLALRTVSGNRHRDASQLLADHIIATSVGVKCRPTYFDTPTSRDGLWGREPFHSWQEILSSRYSARHAIVRISIHQGGHRSDSTGGVVACYIGSWFDCRFGQYSGRPMSVLRCSGVGTSPTAPATRPGCMVRLNADLGSKKAHRLIASRADAFASCHESRDVAE